ncbi:MAG: DEAD/DEAH box helicase [bacterium]
MELTVAQLAETALHLATLLPAHRVDLAALPRRGATVTLAYDDTDLAVGPVKQPAQLGGEPFAYTLDAPLVRRLMDGCDAVDVVVVPFVGTPAPAPVLLRGVVKGVPQPAVFIVYPIEAPAEPEAEPEGEPRKLPKARKGRAASPSTTRRRASSRARASAADADADADDDAMPAHGAVPLPPLGPSKSELIAKLRARLAAYRAATPERRAQLGPELRGALRAFDGYFGESLGDIEDWRATQVVASVEQARAHLKLHPRGVPLSLIGDWRALWNEGWRRDGDRMLPLADYLSGDLWARLDRLVYLDEAPAERDAQEAELRSLLPPPDWNLIASRLDLRDQWLPLPVLAAFLYSRPEVSRRIELERASGVVKLVGEAYGATSQRKNDDPIRNFIGYLNHDGMMFRPPRNGGDTQEVKRAWIAATNADFKEWLGRSDAHMSTVIEAWARVNQGFEPRTYDGGPLDLARWGEEVTPHPHQNAGARRANDQGSMLAAYGVGVGKTYTAIQAIALARQTGRSSRPVVLVPNSLVTKWQEDFAKALPDYAVVVIGEASTPRKGGGYTYSADSAEERVEKWRRFAAGIYDVAIITPTALLRTGMGVKEALSLLDDDGLKRETAIALNNANRRKKPTERESAVQALGGEAVLALKLELGADIQPDGVEWSDLPIDCVVVDEAQNYKGTNEPKAREGGVPQFMGSTAPSKRAWNLYARLASVLKRLGMVFLLSATPAKNSPIELYNLVQLMKPELWTDHGIYDSEGFISRFVKIELRGVIDTNGEYAQRAAVVGFQRLDELALILDRFCEFLMPQDVGLKVPEAEVKIVSVEMDPDQAEVYSDLRKRGEAALAAARRGIKAAAKSLLGILNHMASVAIHPAAIVRSDRLVVGRDGKPKPPPALSYAEAGDFPPHSPKIDALVERIVNNGTSCGHIVFVNQLCVHRWVHDALIKAGVPAAQIGVLNGTLTPSSKQRQAVARAFNGGRLRVVIANAVAYEGLDLQTRTCSIHHLDLPWEPATLTQRNGRAVRQGNRLDVVEIVYYLTADTIDGYRLQMIDGKHGWLGELLKGNDSVANPASGGAFSDDDLLMLLATDREAMATELAAAREQLLAREEARRTEHALELLGRAAANFQGARDAGGEVHPTTALSTADSALIEYLDLAESSAPWKAEAREIRRLRATFYPPLKKEQRPVWTGSWVLVDDFGPRRWYHVGLPGRTHDGHRAMALRTPGTASWTMQNGDFTERVIEVRGERPADVPDDVDVRRYAEDWRNAPSEWVAQMYPRVALELRTRIAEGQYRPVIPVDFNGVAAVYNGKDEESAGWDHAYQLIPPTDEGWQRWLQLGINSDFKFYDRQVASRWWFNRWLRPGQQINRANGGGAVMAKVPNVAKRGDHLLLVAHQAGQITEVRHMPAPQTRATIDAEITDIPADANVVVVQIMRRTNTGPLNEEATDIFDVHLPAGVRVGAYLSLYISPDSTVFTCVVHSTEKAAEQGILTLYPHCAWAAYGRVTAVGA